MINNYLTEAFKSLNILDEDVYDFNEKDIDIVDDKINSNDDETIDVIDAEANNAGELKDSYVGKVIIDCNVCHSKIYKDKEEIVVCDENDCVNVDEECPYCASTEGFVIVGEIAPFNGEEKIDDENVKPNKNVETSDEIVGESLDEAHRESADEDEVMELTLYADNDSDTYHRMTMPTIKNLARKMKAGKFDKDLAVKAFMYVAEYAAKKYKKEFDGDDGVFYKFNPATREEVAKNLLDGSMEHIEGIANGEYNEALDVSDRVTIDTKEDGFLTKKHDLMKDGYKVIGTGDGKIIMAKPKKMDEAIENISIDTGDQVIDIATETKDEKEEETVETIKPVSDYTKEEIKNNNDIDIDVDEFDEESFDELGEAYLKKNYSNVESYKTSRVKSSGNTLRLEGIITFKSGNKKATNFVFESACITKDGVAKFNGNNEEIAKGKKSYTMVGSLKDNKFIAESLHYNYRTKDANGEQKRIFGTSKKR